MSVSPVVVPAGDFGRAALGIFLEACAPFAAPVVGLATGNTPIPLYQALGEAVRARAIGIGHLRPFAIDEYGGPRDHPCSNRAFFARYWDSIAGAPAVGQFDPESASASREAARLGATLSTAGGLDVVVLGIGLNGHLAFNEPGTERTRGAHAATLRAETRESARACWGAGTPGWGLTLGLKELLQSTRAILLASGAAKAEVVARALKGPVSRDCPASFLQEHPALTVVLDEGAASLLT